MAVTTVVRIRGEGDVNAAWSWGNKFSGHIRQSLPKHSATTFRVPEINIKFFYSNWNAEKKDQIFMVLEVKDKKTENRF